MATNEASGFDLTIAADAANLVLAIVQAAIVVIPLLTLAILVLSHLRNNHGRAQYSSVWPSKTSAGTRYLYGEIDRAEYRRAVAGSRRLTAGVR